MDIIIDYCSRIATYNVLKVVIELICISLVVYWVVSFLEGTRGERLFHGVIFLLVAGVLILNLIVERFGFERLQYLYKGFLIAVLIIAVAAFQPEIRRALIRIGRVPGSKSQGRFHAAYSHNIAKAIEEIITAIRHLSITRTGSIIVIEHQVGLTEFIETGVRIDAAITADLLKTIFYPGASLHDMAVIIRGERLVAARVQLPLAEASAEDGTELGSRHRAAIGITNGSDALCVVVSEETGIISIAEKGYLIRGVDEKELRNNLLLAMSEEKTHFGWFGARRSKKA